MKGTPIKGTAVIEEEETENKNYRTLSTLGSEENKNCSKET